MRVDSPHRTLSGIPTLDGLYFYAKDIDGFVHPDFTLPPKYLLHRLSQASTHNRRTIPALLKHIGPGIYADASIPDDRIAEIVRRHASRIAQYLWPGSVIAGRHAFQLWYPQIVDVIFPLEEDAPDVLLLVSHDPGANPEKHVREIGGVRFMLNRASKWMWPHVAAIRRNDSFGDFPVRMLSPAGLCLAHSSPWRRTSELSAKAHKVPDAAFIFAAVVNNEADTTAHEFLSRAGRYCGAIAGSSIAKLNKMSSEHPGCLDSGLISFDEKVDLAYFDTPLGTLYRSGELYTLSLADSFPRGLLPGKTAYRNELPPLIRDMVFSNTTGRIEDMVFTGGLHRTSSLVQQRHRPEAVAVSSQEAPLVVRLGEHYSPNTPFLATVTDSGEVVPDAYGEYYARISPLGSENRDGIFSTWRAYAAHAVAGCVLPYSHHSEAFFTDVRGQRSLVTLIERADIPPASGTPAFEVPMSACSWIELLEYVDALPPGATLADALGTTTARTLPEAAFRHFLFLELIGSPIDLSTLCITLRPDPALPTRYIPEPCGIYPTEIAVDAGATEPDFDDICGRIEVFLREIGIYGDRASRIGKNVSLLIEEMLPRVIEDLAHIGVAAGIAEDAYRCRGIMLRQASFLQIACQALYDVPPQIAPGPTAA